MEPIFQYNNIELANKDKINLSRNPCFSGTYFSIFEETGHPVNKKVF